ncbi:MAG: hypothetical protein Q8L29_02265 [archaeon]|nr:hypothetical protein [archaeon]
MKVLIFDSGPLINLSMNGLLYILEELKKNFDGKFIITEAVKQEVLDRPMEIMRFELGALQIENLIKNKILEMPPSIGISEEKIKLKTREIMNIANHFLQIKGQWLDLVSEAEISCLALSSELKEKNIDSIIAIDERTTRLLCENPQNLERTISEKMHEKAKIVAKDTEIFHQFKFIRSSEIVYVAYKKGVVRISGKKVLEALLYATKFKGTAISFEEIDELKKL